MTYPPCILIHNPLAFKLAFHEEQIYLEIYKLAQPKRQFEIAQCL